MNKKKLDADDREFAAQDQKMSNLALGAGCHPDHVGRVLDHYAQALVDHGDDVDLGALTDAHHAEHVRRIIRDNPQVHVHYKPPTPTGPHADHEEGGVPTPPPGKTFKPGKPNSATRAELRARGVRY
jgi:hypothetical protein